MPAAATAAAPVMSQAPASLPAPAQPGEGLHGAAKWKAEYAADAKLQGEFRSEEGYVAFRKAEAAGRVKVLRQRVKCSKPGAEPAGALAIIAEWKNDPGVRAEFRSFDNFCAYREKFSGN